MLLPLPAKSETALPDSPCPDGTNPMKSRSILMKTVLRKFLLAMAVAFTGSSGKISAQSVKLATNWPSFMARHDLIWERLPENYFEGAFVGNGLLGTIVFRDSIQKNSLCFEIGRTDVYDHRTGAPAHQEGSRLPIGQGLLAPVGRITGAKLRTDLWNAETRGEITTDAGEIKWRCFVPSDGEVIVLELTTTAGERGARFSFRAAQGDSPRHIVLPKERPNYKPNPPFQTQRMDDLEVVVQPLLAGGDYATTWKEVKTDADKRTVYLTVANGIPGGGSAPAAVDALKHAVARGVPAMEKTHREWWHAFYPASFVSVPDARVESFYWIQWYKLASATRVDRPAVDLMGPWFRLSRWSAYWMNLNIQLAYYTVQTGNHLEIGDRLSRWVEDSEQDLINNCPSEFREDSASLGNPTGLRLIAPAPGSAIQGYQFIALPWLMQHCYLQYRYSMDDQRLRDHIYPLLRRTFNLYLHLIQLGEDGLYHIPKAFSDEYGYAEDTSLNIALLRWGLQTLISSSERLKIDDPLLPKWKEVLAKLVDYPVDEKTGIMIGKDTPFARPHRHYSHLFAIFPLYVLNIDDQPERLGLMRQSIHQHVGLNGDNCMYKFTGSSSLSAALGDGDNALVQLQRSLTILPGGPTVTPNTFYSEGGWPTFESPISASRTVLDMLLQSWGKFIRVFPACPSQWRDASFHDLRAEGGFLVSAVRKDGHTRFIRIKSLASEPCRLKCDLPAPVKLVGPTTANLRQHDGVIELDLKRGEEVILYSGTKPDDFVIESLPHPQAECNAWGSKFRK